MSALVRITSGIMPQHSRVGMSRAMAQFGEVIHCHKPPFSGIPGEDFVNVRFASQEAADRAYASLKAGQVFVDGFAVGTGPAPAAKGVDALAIDNGSTMRRRTPSPPRRYGRGVAGYGRARSPDRDHQPYRPPERHYDHRDNRDRRPRIPEPQANFPSRNDPKSPSPRRMAWEMHMQTRSRSRSQVRDRERRHHREDRMDRWQQPNDFATGGVSTLMRLRDKPARSVSPDPPGPAKNTSLVKNPFFRSNGAFASDDADHPGGLYLRSYAVH